MSTTEANKEAYVQDETAAVNGTGPAGKRTFGQKMKRHCARFWWLWFIVFAIVVLVIVLPMYVLTLLLAHPRCYLAGGGA